jgi:hypothetical protein
MPKDFKPVHVSIAADMRNVLWNLRQFDLFGQIIILIVGALSVVVLFRVRKNDE